MSEPMSVGRMIEALGNRRIAEQQRLYGERDTEGAKQSAWLKDALAATAKGWAENVTGSASSRRSGRGG